MTGPNGEVYLRSFWDMITQAVENMPYASADYATTASAIVGKPLALVNVGFSLEFATPRYNRRLHFRLHHHLTP